MSRILLIDADPSAVHSRASLLRGAGHDVMLAACGRDAFNAARCHEPDLVLADLLLGDGTAIDLLRQMNQAGVVTRFVVVTRLGSIETAVAAMRHGAMDYVVTPLVGDDLLATIVRWLAQDVAPHGRVAPCYHSGIRWADAVVQVLHSPSDVGTLAQWARFIGVSSGTLRTMCQMVKAPPRRSLLLARLVRAVHLSQSDAWNPETRLDVRDPRTLRRMLDAGEFSTTGRVTVLELLDRQTLIVDAGILGLLRGALEFYTSNRPRQAPGDVTSTAAAPVSLDRIATAR